jgi:hypothetical protein
LNAALKNTMNTFVINVGTMMTYNASYQKTKLLCNIKKVDSYIAFMSAHDWNSFIDKKKLKLSLLNYVVVNLFMIYRET